MILPLFSCSPGHSSLCVNSGTTFYKLSLLNYIRKLPCKTAISTICLNTANNFDFININMTCKKCLISQLRITENLHSSPAIDSKTLQNQYAELEEKDEEEQEKIERTVPPATNEILHCDKQHKCSVTLQS